MRIKIRLDTMSDINQFVKVVTRIEDRVSLEDNCGHRVSAKSLLGAVYTMEWSEIYCTCDRDISAKILPWVM